MQARYVSILLLLSCSVAVGQSSGTNNAPVPTAVWGVKIKPSTFDSRTRLVRLDFVNDSSADITAWGYCVNTQVVFSGGTRHGFCTLVDALPTVIDHRVKIESRPFLSEPQCEGCQLIHPDEKHTISFDFSNYPDVIDASIELNLVAYSSGAASIAPGEVGESTLRDLTQRRQELLRATQRVIETGNRILANSIDPHPTATMIRQLEAANDPGVSSALEFLRKPEKRIGNESQFIPHNERAYLERFVKDEQTWATVLASNQIRGAL